MKPRRRHSCQLRGSTSVLMFRCITRSWVQRNVPPPITVALDFVDPRAAVTLNRLDGHDEPARVVAPHHEQQARRPTGAKKPAILPRVRRTASAGDWICP